MAVIGRNGRYLALLGAGAAIMVTAMGLLMAYQYAQMRAIEESISRRTDSVTALTFQFEREFLRLRQTLATSLQKGTTPDRDALTLRSDIFQSRLVLLKDNPSVDVLVARPEYLTTLPKLELLGQWTSQALGRETLNADEMQRLLTQFNAIGADVQALTLAANTLESIQFEQQGHKMLRQSNLIVALTVVQIALLLLAFLALVVRHKRQVVDRRALVRLNAELREAQHASEAASVAKSQFLANMSHELRTPFNGILGMLKLLQSTGLNARQQDYADKTERVTVNFLSLLNDILDFSKVEAGKLTLEKHDVKLDSLMQDLAVTLSANVADKPIDVLYDIDPGIPVVVHADSMRLHQVLLNLGGNAIKFTAQGQVVIALRRCKPRDDAAQGQVEIEFSVRDSGIGIAPENHHRIFEGFSQAEASTSRKFGGTGLGLAISKRLVEMMGGTLTLESQLGVGSVFTFTLALDIVHDPSLALTNERQASSEPRRVLIVDDNRFSLDIMARMTQGWGWPTDTAESGEEALDLIEIAAASNLPAYQVVFMDWFMPGMDGWETTRRIRQMHRQSHATDDGGPVIIMVTSHGRESLSERSQADQNMLNGLLIKPVTSSTLLDAALHWERSGSRLRDHVREPERNRRLLGMRILVVEDNLMNQQVARELLALEGAHVTIAENGEVGVQTVQTTRPLFDAVLMDLQMPVMDGYAATRTLRASDEYAELPIIAMTANTMASDRQACLHAGMNEHVGKPFDLNHLVSVLKRLTGHTTQDTGQADSDLAATPASSLDNDMVDVSAALARMSGLQSLYVRAAIDFAAALPATLVDYRKDLEDHQWQTARTRMHTLKGNAGTIGAHALSDAAKWAEQQCAEPVNLPDLLKHAQTLQELALKTQEGLALVIGAMNSGNNPVAASSQVMSDPTRDALTALHGLLKEEDFSALEYFAEVRPQLSTLPADALARLENALQALDLQAALSACADLLAAP